MISELQKSIFLRNSCQIDNRLRSLVDNGIQFRIKRLLESSFLTAVHVTFLSIDLFHYGMHMCIVFRMPKLQEGISAIEILKQTRMKIAN